MPSKDPIVVARANSKGPDTTIVSDMTERVIPFRTWLTCILVSSVDVLAFAAILVMLSRQIWNWNHPPRIYGYGWWPSTLRALSIWWPSAVIAMLASVILWSLPLQYRYLIEQVVKHPPGYENMDPDAGVWNPFGRRVYVEDDEPEMERDTEVVDVNVWDRDKHNRKRLRKLSFPNDRAARLFYRAIVDGTRPFSERTAKDCGVSRRQFRQIRDGLIKQGLGDWKDERNKRQGFEVGTKGIQALDALARAPLPRSRG